MGLRDLAKRISTDRVEMDNQRLQSRFARLDLTPIDGLSGRAELQ